MQLLNQHQYITGPFHVPTNFGLVIVHTLLLVGTSAQVTMVWMVVVGQFPQFDARML